MSAVAPEALPEGQRQALEVLHSTARASDGALMVDLDHEQLDGVLYVRVYLASASLRSSDQGIRLAEWEPIDIAIPEAFPGRPPIASTGRDDFPDVLPHQARGSKFCVRVEGSNWVPEAGMRGFLRAVIDAYQHIALGTLQGHLQPWRPVTADYRGQGWAVIKADRPATGPAGSEDPFRWAVGIQVSDDRIDIVEWLDVSDDTRAAAELTKVQARELARADGEKAGAFLIPAVVMSKPIALEYSDTWPRLRFRLEEQGVDWGRLLDWLARAAAINQPPPGGQERAALLFRVAADTGSADAGQDARFAVARLTKNDAMLLAGTRTAQDDANPLHQALNKLFKVLPVRWVWVYDGRPESIWRRAASRPAARLVGARILLLGCGGLGAPIAEHCVRSGAARLHIVDSGAVSPGVLSRQPYEDADIGKPKAEVLAGRLGRIRRESEIVGMVADIVSSDILTQLNLDLYSLIIDATANRSVASKIERAQRDQHGPWPALVTVAISQRATHGVAAVTPRGTVGAGIDLLRRLGLRTCMSTALADVHAAFFPPEASKLNFRPDTSCSDATFIGSATDIGALAAQLLDGALARLEPRPGSEPPHRSLSIARLGNDDELKAARVVLDLPSDRVIMDHGQTYEVRVDEAVMDTIRGHIRASVNGRTVGAGHTGGLLLGQFDTACRVAWVSQATGLPPESTADPLNIELNTDDVRDFLAQRFRRSGGMLTLIGFWHTHPGSSIAPSETDTTTMKNLVSSPDWLSEPALLLVVGLPADGSTGEPGSPWVPEIHAETYAADQVHP